jgi:phage head maturation protease
VAQMTSAAINDLPDSAFAYIEPGGSKDSEGKTTPRSLRHFPIHDAAHVRNALARIAQGAEFGKQALPKVQAAAKRFGIDTSTASRAEDLPTWPGFITRSLALDDASVRSGRVTCETCAQDATGRIVDAYVAVFGEPAEIRDEQGHYYEDIDRAAFNKRLADLSRSRAGLRDVAVFYNHAMTVHGTPSEVFSLPVGHPSAIRADGRGLLASTHYTSNGERVLQGMKDGDFTGHSFTGRIIRSDPQRVPRVGRSGDLPRVRRLELGLTEYGPTPQPYYAGAQLVTVRSQISPGQHFDEAAGIDPPLPTGAGAEEPPQALRSAEEVRRQIRRALVVRSAHHGRQAQPPAAD